MGYSDKLNGYWEEGYHFYIEIRDDDMIVREYRRKITLRTKISYDAEAVDAGRKTPIVLENNVLSVGGFDNPMSWFEEFYLEDGLIKAVEGYSFMDRKDPFTIKKVDHGPFDHIVIRDDEYLEKLQGVWVQWSPVENGKDRKDCMIIEGNKFRWRLHSGEFHVISYNKPGWDNESVFMVPADLTEDDFHSCTRFEIHPDMITGYEMVFDMSVPMSVFARAENIDKIEVPGAAKQPARSVMGPGAMLTDPTVSMLTQPPISMLTDPPVSKLDKEIMNGIVTDGPKPEFIPVEKEGDDPYRLKKPFKCSKCQEVFEKSLPHFCPNCGWPLR